MISKQNINRHFDLNSGWLMTLQFCFRNELESNEIGRNYWTSVNIHMAEFNLLRISIAQKQWLHSTQYWGSFFVCVLEQIEQSKESNLCIFTNNHQIRVLRFCYWASNYVFSLLLNTYKKLTIVKQNHQAKKIWKRRTLFEKRGGKNRIKTALKTDQKKIRAPIKSDFAIL